MRILVVEDNAIRRQQLTGFISEIDFTAQVESYASAEEALQHVRAQDINVALLDIALPGANGMELARQLQQDNPRINLIFVSAISEFMADALHLHCSGYLVKPVTVDDLRRELDSLRWREENLPAGDGTGAGPNVRMQCFGTFEAYLDDKPMEFRRTKTKELLAYLVSRRGALCRVSEIEAALWESSPYLSSHQSYLRHLAADLNSALVDKRVPDLLIRKRGLLGVDPTTFSCDYYDYLAGKAQAEPVIKQFMAQYSWAEEIQAALFR